MFIADAVGFDEFEIASFRKNASVEGVFSITIMMRQGNAIELRFSTEEEQASTFNAIKISIIGNKPKKKDED